MIGQFSLGLILVVRIEEIFQRIRNTRLYITWHYTNEKTLEKLKIKLLSMYIMTCSVSSILKNFSNSCESKCFPFKPHVNYIVPQKNSKTKRKPAILISESSPHHLRGSRGGELMNGSQPLDPSIEMWGLLPWDTCHALEMQVRFMCRYRRKMKRHSENNSDVLMHESDRRHKSLCLVDVSHTLKGELTV